MNMTKTEQNVRDVIKKVLPEVGEFKLEHPADRQFGDYSTSVAMQIAKEEKRNPREVAEIILEKILRLAQNDEQPIIKKVEIAGPGFINFYLKDTYLKEAAEKINFETEFRNLMGAYGQGKTVVIDYSAPNIAKPFGIGHLRSTNIGQAIYNLYKLLGWKTIGDNHLGDWGTQFGKLIVAIKKWGEKTELTVENLEKLYVKFHEEAEKDETLIEQGRAWFEKLEKGDPEAKRIWEECVTISMREFDRVYEMLGVNIDYVLGESFYQDKMGAVVDLVREKNILKKSQGAEIIEFPSMPPVMISKSNETTTYFTRDMATIKYRLDTWKPDLMIYEVGADQDLHFRQLFAVAKMLGWECDYTHVAHGLIRWKDGKFSTRKGKTIHLSDIIEGAMTKAQDIADRTEVSKKLTATEREEMIKAVAIGAVKFNDLSSDPKRDIIFDWEQMMSLEGDSGPYLQYTYARCKSVLTKTKVMEQKDIESLPETLTENEREMLRFFYLFEEKILDAAESFNPAIIANYLLEVARAYNEFYAKNKIIGDKNETFRVFLTRTTASLLQTGLGLLGIKTPEKM